MFFSIFWTFREAQSKPLYFNILCQFICNFQFCCSQLLIEWKSKDDTRFDSWEISDYQIIVWNFKNQLNSSVKMSVPNFKKIFRGHDLGPTQICWVDDMEWLEYHFPRKHWLRCVVNRSFVLSKTVIAKKLLFLENFHIYANIKIHA